MATFKDVLAIAIADIGYKESPPNSNITKYGKWYGLDGQPWCVMAVDYWFDKAGALNLLPTKTASCTLLMNAAKAADLWVTKDYKPGDVPIYNFSGKYHTGIIESVYEDTVVAIEGNTGIGNNTNGGEVMRRTRNVANIMGAVRPKYKEVVMDETTQAMKWASDNGLIQDGNWNATPTRRQLAIVLYRFARLIGKVK